MCVCGRVFGFGEFNHAFDNVGNRGVESTYHLVFRASVVTYNRRSMFKGCRDRGRKISCLKSTEPVSPGRGFPNA
jgi:hypothetical protein